jgi:ADP-ribosyl-[dinitrogen reductase] hydrolase
MTIQNVNSADRFRGALLGLACGDALGTTLEFLPSGTFEPITEMRGGGVFNLPPGAWTDDTSMALCLAASLLETGRFDALDQMKRYRSWKDAGYFSSIGRCFDIGNTVLQALSRFEKTSEAFSGPTASFTAGNGSIMRLAPVPMFFWPDRTSAVEYSGLSSRTTHGCVECVEACCLFGSMLFKALEGQPKESVLFDHSELGRFSPNIQTIASGAYRSKLKTQICGSGYVVQSLEAALWSFFTTESLEQAVLAAVNLGDDADTTGAVCGQIAGAFYGASAIPPRWLERLVMADVIRNMADRLFASRSAQSLHKAQGP